MKKNLLFIFVSFVLIFVLSCSQGDVGPTGPTGENAAVLQFKQGVYPSDAYSGTTDSYLESNLAADTNNGLSNYLYAGRFVFEMFNDKERFLLRFDIGELQNQHIKIQKAQIILFCNILVPSSTTITVTPYEVTESWIENEVTWNSRKTGLSWSAPGGVYSSTPAGNSVYIDKAVEYKIFNINSSIVQKWIDTPDNNHGLIFVSDTESIAGNRWVGFFSSNTSTGSQRPQLIIYYTLK